MKLKKEFSEFYAAIRIDSESHVLKENAKFWKMIYTLTFRAFFQIMVFL